MSVRELPCLVTPSGPFDRWREWFNARGYRLACREVADLQPRHLREQREVALGMNEQGLWLIGQGLKIQPDWAREYSRWQRATVKTERLARAVFGQEAHGERLQVVDGTAGLGHDGGLLAALGADVTLLEQEPLVLALLLDEWERASSDDRLAAIASRIQVVEADSQMWCQQKPHRADVMTLDPMFPVRQKTALVRKEMQVLQHVHQGVELTRAQEAAWLAAARAAGRRVVVKRPVHAAPLGGVAADAVWAGPVCRFDGYLQPRER